MDQKGQNIKKMQKNPKKNTENRKLSLGRLSFLKVKDMRGENIFEKKWCLVCISTLNNNKNAPSNYKVKHNRRNCPWKTTREYFAFFLFLSFRAQRMLPFFVIFVFEWPGNTSKRSWKVDCTHFQTHKPRTRKWSAEINALTCKSLYLSSLMKAQ